MCVKKKRRIEKHEAKTMSPSQDTIESWRKHSSLEICQDFSQKGEAVVCSSNSIFWPYFFPARVMSVNNVPKNNSFL